MDFDVQIALRYINTGMKVLSARVLLVLGLLLEFALFCAAMWQPTWERVALAALFGALVYLPLLGLDKRQSRDREIVAPEE